MLPNDRMDDGGQFHGSEQQELEAPEPDQRPERGDTKQRSAPSRGDTDQAKAKPDSTQEEDEEGETKKPLSRRAKIVIAIVAIVVAAGAIIYGIYWWTRGSYYQSTNDAYLQADQVNIAPRISGYVTEVLVRDNQDVQAGQPLIRIAERDYQARIDQDRSQIAEARASLLEADAQIHQQKAQVSQNEAQLGQSNAQIRQYSASAQFNGTQARRYRPLAASGAETDEKLATYVSQAQQARAQVEAAQSQSAADAAKIEYARRQIDIYRAQQLAAQAKIDRAEAQLAADLVDLDATTVVSSIAGRVGDRTVRVGQYLQTGTRVMTVVPVADLYVKANFKETQIGLMRIGQPARVTVDALSDTVLQGTVESFSPGTGAQFALVPTDNATGNFTKITQRVPVRVRLKAGPQARKVLVPGLSVIVEVDTISAKSDLDREHDESEARQNGRESANERADGQTHERGAGNE